VPCTAGYFAANENSTQCTACELNTYSSVVGATSCTRCSSGYVTGGTGSTSSSSCVNLAINFALGIVCLCVCIMGISIYIIFGRLQRVAFKRRFLVTFKNIAMFGLLTKTLVTTLNVCNILLSHRASKRREKELLILGANQKSFRYYYIRMKQILKPYAFAVVAVLTFSLLILFTLLEDFLLVLFNALLLWRGYSMYINANLSFLDRVTIFLSNIDVSLHTNLVSTLLYPFTYILAIIANLQVNINLASVSVSCAGSQAPIYLLVDFIIVGIIVLIIESDVHIFWVALVRDVSLKYCLLTTNHYYMRFIFFSTVKVPFYNIVSVLLLLLPSPMKIMQYALGFVAVGLFFTQDFHSASTANCDNAMAFPVDTMEAILTTVVVVLVMPVLAYMFSQILVPSFRMEGQISRPTIDENTELPNNGSCNRWWYVQNYISTLLYFFL